MRIILTFWPDHQSEDWWKAYLIAIEEGGGALEHFYPLERDTIPAVGTLLDDCRASIDFKVETVRDYFRKGYIRVSVSVHHIEMAPERFVEYLKEVWFNGAERLLVEKWAEGHIDNMPKKSAFQEEKFF